MPEIKQIECKDALEMVRTHQAILIDVREPEEFAEGHIPYALSMPMSKIEQALAKCELPEDKPIIFQCQGGVRSQRVCDFVAQTKCLPNDIYNLVGGFKCWKDESLPTL